MVNDTNTLNGSLAQLGETLASNITQKGVTASASDGLTTLANKVLQISGDTPTPPTPTVLFEDSGVTGTKNDDFLCTKTSGNYTLTTDSTGTTFVCTGSDGFYIPNIDIHSYSDLEITWTFTYGTRYACHISLLNSNKSYSNNMRWHNTGTSTPGTSWYIPSGQTSISHTLTSGDEMKLTLSNGTWSLYCEDELIGTATPNYDVYYIGLTSADGNRPFGYKDLVIKDTNGGGSTTIYEDDCSVDNTSDYGSSISLRNSGTSTIAYNSNEYYTITNTKSQAESFIPITDLTGLTGDFTLEYDSYIQQTGGSSGLVIYNSSSAWIKLTDDGSSDKKLWYGYNDGSFHETAFYGSETTYQKWVHYKYTVEDDEFSMKVTYNNTVIASYTATIGFTRDSTTKIGLDSEWQSNTVTRYKNIIVKTLGSGSDCSQYTTQINNAITYINGSGS